MDDIVPGGDIADEIRMYLIPSWKRLHTVEVVVVSHRRRKGGNEPEHKTHYVFGIRRNGPQVDLVLLERSG